MPKKTKKQKLLAELHRKISVVSSYTPQFVKTQNKTTASTVLKNNLSQYSYDNRAVTTTKTLKSDLDYSYIKTDMVKILVFTLFALISQGVLYFFLRTR